MKSLKSYEINQPKDSNEQVIAIDYSLSHTRYITELIRAMANSHMSRGINRRKFFALCIIAESREGWVSAFQLRKTIGYKADLYVRDIEHLEREGLLIVEREIRLTTIKLSLEGFNYVSELLPSFKFVRPKHLIFD